MSNLHHDLLSASLWHAQDSALESARYHFGGLADSSEDKLGRRMNQLKDRIGLVGVITYSSLPLLMVLVRHPKAIFSHQLP